MTVSELIAALSTHDPAATVVLMDHRGDPSSVFKVEAQTVTGPKPHDRRELGLFADNGPVTVVLIS